MASAMKPDRKRMLAALAAHVLEAGLTHASLRPLAAAAGTSDRMLIYHFGSKEALIAEILEHLANEMAAGLDALIPARRYAEEGVLVREIVALLRSDLFKPYCAIWLEILSVAARGGTAHRAAAQAIIRIFLDWLAARHPRGESGSAATLTLIEGIVVMDVAGRSDVADTTLDALLGPASG
ncbi:MAG: TetR family transcriptional regulator [Methylobacterium sp.]|nr:MAG: TetR family transcriptional regulator [Methylobacterium sp.]